MSEDDTAQSDLVQVPDRNDMRQGVVRAGYTFRVLGRCLKPGDPLWTDAQRRDGVIVKMVYLTSTEERNAIRRAIADGAPSDAALNHMKAALFAIDGKKIGHLEVEDAWEALGPLGRNITASAFQLANAPAEEAMAAMRASFSATG